jgi:hypothetical protein
MKIFVNKQFEVYGSVKPGAVTKSLIESTKSGIEKLTMNDFPMMCSGTNDVERNGSRNVFNIVISFIRSVDRINIILLCSLQISFKGFIC